MTRSLFSAAVCMGLSLGLIGCSGAPSPIPRGYSSYEEPYKSAPGPDARSVGYDYNNEKNLTVLEDMRYAASDLVEKLDQKLSFGVDEIYLDNPANTAFYNSFDHLLRDELSSRGYLLSDTPDGNVHVQLVVRNSYLECAEHIGEASDDYKMMYMALAMDAKDDIPADIVEGFYEVPVYDYKPVGHMKLNKTGASHSCQQQK